MTPHPPEAGPGAADEALDAALDLLLAQHPHALVGALDPNGLFVAVPGSVPITTQRTLTGRSPIDMVTAADRVVVIEVWERAKAVGGARAPVHLRVSADAPVEFNIFDQRRRHGVFILVVPIIAGTDTAAQVADAPLVMPRVTRMEKNEMAVVISVDEAAERLLGWPPAEIVGKRTLDFVHPDDHSRAIECWMEMLGHPGATQRTRMRHLRADGSWLWTEVHNHNLLDDPEHGHVLAEMIDISDEMAAHEALRAREQLLNRLAEALPTGIIQVRPDRAVLYTNERLHQIVGIPLAPTIGEQLAAVATSDRPAVERALTAVLAGHDVDLEVQLRRAGDDEVRLCQLSMRSLSEDDGTVTGAIISVADVTESARLRRELEHRATFDTLTRCHNRASMMSTLEKALGAGAKPLAVVFIDLDDFKAVNDDLGHAAGDELLVVVADRLREVTRAGDVVGRLGGDEFLLICPGVGTDRKAVELGDRVAAALNRTAFLGAGPVPLRASVGVVHAVPGTVTADALVARADVAMYESKSGNVGLPVVHRL